VSFVTVLVLQTSASRFLRHYVDTLS
jgi:hypothetical protein